MIIVLMGYMGSGKSLIGLHLSNNLDYNFVDLDNYIELEEEKSISEIFKTKGEIYFRKKESEYLKKIISEKNNLVLSLGGGTPCYANNLELVLNSDEVNTFYLKTSIPELVKRLWLEKSKRPVISHLKSDDEFTEFIGKHLFERSPYYSQANYVVDTDKKSKDKIVEEIILKLV